MIRKILLLLQKDGDIHNWNEGKKLNSIFNKYDQMKTWTDLLE